MEANQPMRIVRYQDRPGFETKGMRWVYRLLYPFFHCKVEIPDELRSSEEPVVFIANHYRVFGPASYVLSMPVITDIWINEPLVEKAGAAQLLYLEIEKKLPFLGEKQKVWMSRKIGSLASNVLTRFGVIPVDREQPMKLISTMRKSLKSLEEGKNLLIFPETATPDYSLTSVTPFYSGFSALGQLYYRKTGRNLKFCPCYIDEQHHSIRVGEPVLYNHEEDDIQLEKERISNELQEQIKGMAMENRGIRKAALIPGRRSFLAIFNVIRLLLLLPLFGMLQGSGAGLILFLYGIAQCGRILFAYACKDCRSSNGAVFLISKAINDAANIGMLVFLSFRSPGLKKVQFWLVLNTLVILISNIATYTRHHRCAGVNYYDILSMNLESMVIILSMLLHSQDHLVTGILEFMTVFFLICATCFGLMLNGRLNHEDTGSSGKHVVR